MSFKRLERRGFKLPYKFNQKNFKNAFLFVTLVTVAFLQAPASSYSAFYKYVDENGVIHFTNAPVTANYTFYKYENNEVLEEEEAMTLGKFDHIIIKASNKYNVDKNLVKAVIKAESNFDPFAISRAGAMGLMQLMPETADYLGVDNVFNPTQNIHGGVKYLRRLLNKFQTIELALAAYNAGETAVIKYNDIPPYKETQGYVKKVLRFQKVFKSIEI